MALNFSEKKRLLEKLPLENEFINAKTINSFNPWFGADGDGESKLVASIHA